MGPKRQPGALVCSIFAIILAVLGSGCGEELGPERMPVTHVSGVVVEGGNPVGGGWIEFIPVEGTVGNFRSARLCPDGSFEADQVAVGENALRLVNAPIKTPGWARLFGAFTTPIRRIIPRQPRQPLKIDLVEELILYQKSHPPATDRALRKTGTAP
jgi:hypothetical protein